MADHCSFCDTRRPEGGTNHLVLGNEWLEFCTPCGARKTLTNRETGEQITVLDLFNRLGLEEGREPIPVPEGIEPEWRDPNTPMPEPEVEGTCEGCKEWHDRWNGYLNKDHLCEDCAWEKENYGKYTEEKTMPPLGERLSMNKKAEQESLRRDEKVNLLGKKKVKEADKDVSMSDLKDHLEGDIEDMKELIEEQKSEIKEDEGLIKKLPEEAKDYDLSETCPECDTPWEEGHFHPSTPAMAQPKKSVCEGCGKPPKAGTAYCYDCMGKDKTIYKDVADLPLPEAWKGAKKSDEAQEFISKEISHLMKDKGYEQDRAVAAAHEVARGKGYKVPNKKSGLVGKKVTHASVKLAHVQANPQYAQAFQPMGNGKYVITADMGNKDWGIGTLWELSEMDGEQVLARVVEDTPEASTQILAKKVEGQKIAKTASIHTASDNLSDAASNLPLGGTEVENAEFENGLISGDIVPEKQAGKMCGMCMYPGKLPDPKCKVCGGSGEEPAKSAAFDQIFKTFAAKKPKGMSWTRFAALVSDFLAEASYTKKAERSYKKGEKGQEAVKSCEDRQWDIVLYVNQVMRGKEAEADPELVQHIQGCPECAAFMSDRHMYTQDKVKQLKQKVKEQPYGERERALWDRLNKDSGRKKMDRKLSTRTKKAAEEVPFEQKEKAVLKMMTQFETSPGEIEKFRASMQRPSRNNPDEDAWVGWVDRAFEKNICKYCNENEMERGTTICSPCYKVKDQERLERLQNPEGKDEYFVYKAYHGSAYGGPEEGGWDYDTSTPADDNFEVVKGYEQAWARVRELNEKENIDASQRGGAGVGGAGEIWSEDDPHGFPDQVDDEAIWTAQPRRVEIGEDYDGGGATWDVKVFDKPYPEPYYKPFYS